MYGTMSSRIIVRKEKLDVEELLAPMYATHKSTVNQSYAWRIENLRKLRTLHTKHSQEWEEALMQDLSKHRVEAVISEIKLNVGEIDYFLRNLKTLMKPTKVASMGYNAPCFSQVEDVPLRPPAVLIIGSSNYPLNVTLSAAAGALAGGNPVVIKPSEQAPAVSQLMFKLCMKYFDKGSVQAVEGGREVVTPLIQHEWAKIVFTGSERVGRIVAGEAAKTLTPVLLELGGKSPCYVDEDAPSSLKLAAQRIIWGKTFNSGQTVSCVYWFLWLLIDVLFSHLTCFACYSASVQTISWSMKVTWKK
jgi:acyl-CoA reductase-like NAD-dependent aldehyde dehydrogenase